MHRKAQFNNPYMILHVHIINMTFGMLNTQPHTQHWSKVTIPNEGRWTLPMGMLHYVGRIEVNGGIVVVFG